MDSELSAKEFAQWVSEHCDTEHSELLESIRHKFQHVSSNRLIQRMIFSYAQTVLSSGEIEAALYNADVKEGKRKRVPRAFRQYMRPEPDKY